MTNTPVNSAIVTGGSRGIGAAIVTRLDADALAVAVKRLGQPDDIAAAVAFLAGPNGAWINGQVLRANANGGVIQELKQ